MIILPPWDTKETVLARMDECPLDASILGYFFTQGFRLVKKELGSDVAEELEESLSKKIFIPFLSYPMVKFLKILEILSNEMGPDEAHAAAATAMLTPFFSSPLGSFMFTLARTTPHTLIEASVAGYRGCVSWGERIYTRVGEKEALMEFRNDLLGPAWHAVGIFPPAIQKACGVTAMVTVEDMDEDHMNFKLRTTW